MYQHINDITGECAINGSFAEQLFVKRFNERFGTTPTKTSTEVDKYQHKDYICEAKGHTMSCDVKYPKKVRREDSEVSNDFTWIELTTKGFLGWVYGKQDYIAFLLPNCREFLMVPRKELLEYCKKMISSEVVLEPDMAYHKIYIRVNENIEIDALSLFSYKELEELEKTWRM